MASAEFTDHELDAMKKKINSCFSIFGPDYMIDVCDLSAPPGLLEKLFGDKCTLEELIYIPPMFGMIGVITKHTSPIIELATRVEDYIHKNNTVKGENYITCIDFRDVESIPPHVSTETFFKSHVHLDTLFVVEGQKIRKKTNYEVGKCPSLKSK
jgi:hypothetical protein